MHQHDSIDRIAPTLEPDQPVLLHQNWHHLGFFHWEIPAAELQALIPPRLTVDTFEGKAFVGLVPFTLTGVRPVMLPPLPWVHSPAYELARLSPASRGAIHGSTVSRTHEINVRTYVHLDGRDPGVWFFSLDASSGIAVEAARGAYKLPYFESEIAFEATQDAIPAIRFDARRTDARGVLPANAHLEYRPIEGSTAPAAPGTLEHFLVERYILYAQDEQRQLHRARVHHQPYPVQRCETGELTDTLVWAAGIKRAEQPAYRHYAREVNVKVYPVERC